MLNPYSAVSRIKNQLAYKLGSCMIEHDVNGGGYLSLIYKLYKIKKEHFKEKKIYQQIVKIFPNFIYPDIKTLNDYTDSIKIKFHLSYMLGQTLIQADKNKFKGGYLTLFKDIKQSKKDYKTIKQLLNDFNIVSPIMYDTIANNKETFIKNFNIIKNILKTHKDYQAIIDNIFHNFDYVLKHLDLIQEWLLSDDFYEKYKKENHPYPSLLDPKKLNDENEEINYNNIPAELAWEMNLPLPENYEFVWLAYHGTGTEAMKQYFMQSSIIFQDYFIEELYESKKMYLKSYSTILKYYKTHIVCIRIKELVENDLKFCFMIQKKVNLLIQVRDPISIFKSFSNHRVKKEHYEKITLNTDLDKIFDNIMYFSTYSNCPIHLNKDNVYHIGKNMHRALLFENTFLNLFKKNFFKNILYVDTEDINKNNFSRTLYNISQTFNLNLKINNIQHKHFVNNDLSILLPDSVMLSQMHEENLENIVIIYITLNRKYDIKKFFSITEYYPKNSYFKSDILLLVDLDKVKQVKLYFRDVIINFFKKFDRKLTDRFFKNKHMLVKEEEIINAYRNNRSKRKMLRELCDFELLYIKQHRPDIIASWKYYQEFEKMCEELDG